MDDNKKTVLITGAAGYIGRHVVREFLDRGYRVIASDLSFKGVDERAEYSHVPIFSGKSTIYEELGSPDILVHLAWRDGFMHNSDAHMADLSAHVGFLKNMMDGGVKHLSVMGSMHEVGYHEGVIDADTPCNPLSMYGISKNALRQFVLLYARETKVDVTWLRAYYIYGDDLRGSSVFSKIAQAHLDGKKTFPFTTGKNEYDFISIYELAKMITAASIQNKKTGIINVCSGKPVALGEMIEEYIKKNNYDITLEYGRYKDRPYDSPRVWGDASDINEIMSDY